MPDERVSYNFSIAKVLSILMVVIGHYFGSILWVPTTIALFVFAFSSGYFTSQKYNNNYSMRSFWKAKIFRLLPSLIIINIFLFVIFVYQQRSGIYSWQSIPAILGMSGILEWFHIQHITPYGAGLWFFTLLIIFYAVYPLLDKLNRQLVTATTFLIVLILMATYLHYHVNIGYSLWITAFAFYFGVYTGRYSIAINPLLLLVCMASILLAMLFLNIRLNVPEYNFFFILGASLATSYFLINGDMRSLPLRYLLGLSGCIIDIYFIHSYLFLHTSGYSPIFSFVFSTCVIIITSLILHSISVKLRCAFSNILTHSLVSL